MEAAEVQPLVISHYSISLALSTLLHSLSIRFTNISGYMLCASHYLRLCVQIMNKVKSSYILYSSDEDNWCKVKI